MPEWIPYETADEPALEVSIDVDLDGDAAFKAAHPYLVTVTVSGFTSDAGGQPDDAAAERLFALEQRAEAACSANGATPAFTVSGAGTYRLFAYAGTGDIETPLREATAEGGMRVDIRAERDDTWAAYEEYALRGDELENARDCDLIEQMEESNEDLSEEYIVTFEWSIQNERAIETALQALRGAGYSVPADPYDDVISVAMQMLITPDALHDARTAIARVLAPYQPSFEGWEYDALDEEAIEPA